VFLWFVGGSVVVVWQVFRSSGFDYRVVVLGAVLPLLEAPLGGPRLLHTLLSAVVVLVVVMAATRHRRLARRRWLGLPIGLFLHLVLDGVWTRRQVFWWPLFGRSFGAGGLPEFSRGSLGLVLEALGALALWWCWRAFGLAAPARRRRLWRTGRLTEG
jgi:hypothetical protein